MHLKVASVPRRAFLNPKPKLFNGSFNGVHEAFKHRSIAEVHTAPRHSHIQGIQGTRTKRSSGWRHLDPAVQL